MVPRAKAEENYSDSKVFEKELIAILEGLKIKTRYVSNYEKGKRRLRWKI